MAIERLNTVSEKVKTALTDGREGAVPDILGGLRPFDRARVLRRLGFRDRVRVFDLIPTATAGEVFQEFERGEQRELLAAIGAERAAPILDEMAADEAADLLAGLEPAQRGRLLALLGEEEAARLRLLMAHPPQSAGGIMTTEFIALSADRTVRDVFAELRRVSRAAETIYYLYVVDLRGRLVGVLSLRDLIMADPGVRLEEIMVEDIVAVRVEADQEEVARMIEQYDLLAAPVVNERGVLLGIVTVDDVIDVITDEATEDIARLGAISGEMSGVDDLRAGAVPSARKRLPWLVLLLFIGLISGNIIARFEGTLEAVVVLAVFIPMITDMAGNTGTQSLAVVVRGLALGQFRAGQVLHLLRRELGVGVIVGTANGAVIALVAAVWQRDALLGFIIGFSLWVTLIVATLMGAVVPLILNRFRIDPAVASGPFITTINDIVGLTIYFTIATTLLL